MKILIGHTGLVGSTLLRSKSFDYCYNTSNFHKFNEQVKDGDDITLCCLPATKWLVNKNLKKDMENILSIINRLSSYFYNNIVLISTIDVYCDSPIGVDEKYKPNIGKLNYGNNRYLFELLVQEYLKTENLKIFRLPALFNKSIKKNIIYDLLNNNNIESINLNSSYQWYNLDNLHQDIKNYLLKFPSDTIFNLFPEPIDTQEIVKLFPYKINKFDNRIEYNYKSVYGNHNKYIDDKDSIVQQIQELKNVYNK